MTNTQDFTADQIVDYVDSLLSIDSDNLDMEAIRNTKIFTELNRIYRQQAKKLATLINQKDKVEHQRVRHYSGKMSAQHYKEEPLTEAILKSDIPQYLNIDPVVIEIRELVREQENTVKFLEDSKQTLRSRGFDIKNAIEFRKMMMGG